MAYLVGYYGVMFFISYLIVHFGMKGRYVKKHGVPMAKGKEIFIIIMIGIVLSAISTLSK